MTITTTTPKERPGLGEAEREIRGLIIVAVAQAAEGKASLYMAGYIAGLEAALRQLVTDAANEMPFLDPRNQIGAYAPGEHRFRGMAEGLSDPAYAAYARAGGLLHIDAWRELGAELAAIVADASSNGGMDSREYERWELLREWLQVADAGDDEPARSAAAEDRAALGW